MSDSIQDAVAKAKAAMAGASAPSGNDTLAKTTSDPQGAKAPNHAQEQANAGVGVASAAPRLGPEINPGPHPTPRPNPGAGEPAAPSTTTLPSALIPHPGAALEPKKGGKVFHNTHPGSTFIAKSGVVYSFDAKGELSVTDPEVIKELDAIADKPGCPVYTKNYVPGQNEGQPKEEILSRAAQTRADLSAQASRMIR